MTFSHVVCVFISHPWLPKNVRIAWFLRRRILEVCSIGSGCLKNVAKIASCDFAKLKIHLEIPMIKSCCSQSMSNWIYVRNSEKITPLIPNLVKCDRKSQCLKITEKVAFNIASEASYVYILSGQKFIKNAEKRYIWRVFENLKFAVKQCYQTCQFSQDKKLLENAKNEKFKWDILSNFQTLWKCL